MLLFFIQLKFGEVPDCAAWSKGQEIEQSDHRWLHPNRKSSGSFCVATRAFSAYRGIGRVIHAILSISIWKTIISQYSYSDAQLNDTATLAAISDIGLEAPFGTDDCFDETETFDPFLNLDLGNFIEEVFSKPPDKTDVAREYAVPDVEQLPPLLPSLVPNTMLSSLINIHNRKKNLN